MRILLAVLVLVALSGLALGFAWLVPPACSLEPKEISLELPDGEVATVFQVNCGATTNYVDWLVVWADGNSGDPRSNRLVAIEGEIVELGWSGGVLEVRYRTTSATGREIFLSENIELGFEVEFTNIE